MENVNALAFATELSKKFREACDTLRTNGLDPTKDGVTFSYGAMLALCDSIEHLKRERDAAVEDLSSNWKCAICKHKCYPIDECPYYKTCGLTYIHWQWRGVQEVE